MIEGYFAKWHGRPLKEITTDEVFRLHQRLGKENGRYAANRAVALLRTMFNLARDWGHLEGANPAARIKFYHEEKRDRFLSPEELRRVNAALVDEPNPYWRGVFSSQPAAGYASKRTVVSTLERHGPGAENLADPLDQSRPAPPVAASERRGGDFENPAAELGVRFPRQGSQWTFDGSRQGLAAHSEASGRAGR